MLPSLRTRRALVRLDRIDAAHAHAETTDQLEIEADVSAGPDAVADRVLIEDPVGDLPTPIGRPQFDDRGPRLELQGGEPPLEPAPADRTADLGGAQLTGGGVHLLASDGMNSAPPAQQS